MNILNVATIWEVLDTVVTYIENNTNNNGYNSFHDIRIDNASNNPITYTIVNKDSDDCDWINKFNYFKTPSQHILVNDNNDKLNVDNCTQKELIEFIFKSLLDKTYIAHKDIEFVYNKCFNKSKDELEDYLKILKRYSENAYSWYMYEEAAERGYDAKSSREAWSLYCAWSKQYDEIKQKIYELEKTGE